MWREKIPGTKIRLHDGLVGTVVINFETELTAEGYKLGGWSDEEGGLLVLTADLGLVRYSKEILDLRYQA